jgi:MFS family permease
VPQSAAPADKAPSHPSPHLWWILVFIGIAQLMVGLVGFAVAGGAIGLLLGGVLTEYMDWRWTLYVNLVFALVAFIGGLALLARTARDRSATLDVPGTLLVSGGLFGIVYGFANAESEDWGPPQTWGFLLAGVVLLAVFTWWQTRSSHPLLPLRVLADRNRAASFIAILISGAGMFGVFLFLTYYIQQILGYTPVESGLAFLPMVAALMLGTVISNNVLIPRIGPKPVVPLGMDIAAAGMVWMTTLGLDSEYVAHVLPQIVVAGFGLGLVMAPAMSLATQGAATHDAGVASATLNTMQQVGGSIGTALLTTFTSSAATDYLSGRNPQDPVVLAQASLGELLRRVRLVGGVLRRRAPRLLPAVPAGASQNRTRTPPRSSTCRCHRAELTSTVAPLPTAVPPSAFVQQHLDVPVVSGESCRYEAGGRLGRRCRPAL